MDMGSVYRNTNLESSVSSLERFVRIKVKNI